MSTSSLKIGDRIEVNTERLAYGGDAIAHHQGLTVFVPLAAPGERLRVRVVERKKNYARAIIEAIVEPSPQRRAPLCAHFGDCGGCQLQHLNYDAQLAAKAAFIRDALTRIGKIDWPHDIAVLHADEVSYRARAQVKLERGRGPSDQPLRVGFNRAASTAVCDVVACPVLVPELDAALAHLREMASNATRAARAGLLDLREIEMAAGDDGVAVAPKVSDLPAGTIRRTINGLTYQFSPTTFFQGNALLLEALTAEALDDYAGRLAIDLYAGVGLFTLPLARRFERVISVESDNEAARFARQNITANQIVNVKAQHARVEQWLADFAAQRTVESAPVDLLLLDPPRTGAAAALAGMIAVQPARIVYVSCDPPTLARDLRRLLDAGYTLDRVTGVDLFPQTYHVETVAHLIRQ
ncbi:MAG TPA: class I SAM-dependent RNA methyltransferase [Blastocatellia bacterium]|nr:class I SAM-dependent RNA methyltransferase [Blastocatellia bacterium]